MVELRTGTLAFLFTDVEGSSGLWEREPATMRAALARHDQIIEHLVEQHGGVVVRARGEDDSRFAVFRSSLSAVHDSLDGLASVAAVCGDAREAVRMFAAVDSTRVTINQRRPPDNQRHVGAAPGGRRLSAPLPRECRPRHCSRRTHAVGSARSAERE